MLFALIPNARPDQPLHEQYFDYMVSMIQLDLGRSIWHNEPVVTILAKALPWTLFITSIAFFLSFILAVVLGALMAYFEGGKFDASATIFSIISTSIPYYISAVLLVYVLGYQLGWFPTGGHAPSDVEPGLHWSYISGLVAHATLPILSLVTGFAGRALGMRANSISILGEDYLRVAQLRGLPTSNIIITYVARNAILPIYTRILITIGFLLGGSIILETIFAYPGVGYYMFKAINSRDDPLMMGGFLIITISVVIAVYVADLTYGLVDPRVKTGGDRRESY